MATLVATTNPSGSRPMTRFSSAATGTTRPACGRMRMIDHQLRRRALPQMRALLNIRQMDHKNRFSCKRVSHGGRHQKSALPVPEPGDRESRWRGPRGVRGAPWLCVGLVAGFGDVLDGGGLGGGELAVVAQAGEPE